MENKQKRSRTVQEEAVREYSYWKRNLLWTFLLFAVVLVIGLFRGAGLSVSPTATELLLTMHDGSSVAVPYETITDAVLMDAPEYGEPVDGKAAGTGMSGTWKQSEWGTYTLCVYRSSEKAIKLTTDEAVYVISLGSSADTEQLYTVILEKSQFD